MSIDSRLTWIRSFLKGLNSPLSEFRPFGIAWSFFRALAAVENEIEMTASQLRRDFDIRTAEGPALESLAAVHGVYRIEPTFASGYVLVKSDAQQRLSPRMIFSTFDQSIQLSPTVELSVSSVERPVPFRTITRGNLANLPAGTPLFSGFASGVFVVGASRNGADPVGGFSGGFDVESDAALRQRLMRALIGDSTSRMLSVLQQRFPGQFFQIQEGDPAPGYFTVHAFNSEDSFVRAVDEFVSQHKPLGSAHVIRVVRRQPLDLIVSGVGRETALDLLNRYFNAFVVGQAFEPQFLMQYLGSRAQLISPLTRIEPRKDSVLVLGSVKVA